MPELSGPEISIATNGTIVTAEELYAINNAIRNIVESLRSDISTNFREWKGAARVEYERVQQGWDRDIAEANAALEGHTGLLLDLADAWTRADQRGVSMWQG
ncbi:WXG100 family type VII secretion target [Streptomyces sp. PSKA30]|uniref:WXG100 family type VII secretion target n=1 Tax=Streptomyces sp. PSKA30 TaxID=2874597 RepID=UPI001CD0E120|nr:WXG100 family type VII secretion target [Streptomyces sp. PSKA30]MBZ9641076.1 WXG100 family type VII secretion target [Streptomyces sp. PSKA30]